MTQKSLFISGVVILALVVPAGVYWLNQFPIKAGLAVEQEKTFDPRIALDESLPDVSRAYWYCEDGSKFRMHILQGHVVVTLDEEVLRSFPVDPSNSFGLEDAVTVKTDLGYSYVFKDLDGLNNEILLTDAGGTITVCASPRLADN